MVLSVWENMTTTTHPRSNGFLKKLFMGMCCLFIMQIPYSSSAQHMLEINIKYLYQQSQFLSISDQHPWLVLKDRLLRVSDEGSQLNPEGPWLPKYARENPAGHAPTCQMEVAIENQMTIPVWVRAGRMDALPQAGTGNLYLRFRLLRF